ncbi:hypothetical protein D4M51_21795 [Enterobacter hormaechei]|nr:hypothetical protein D4M51_21795 [Enterobacter hormaechei]TXX07002.1 hypothetical protein D4M55_17095 [Enterobacter hormaechei]
MHEKYFLFNRRAEKQGNSEKRSFGELALAYSLMTTKLLFYATYICDIIAYINFPLWAKKWMK